MLLSSSCLFSAPAPQTQPLHKESDETKQIRVLLCTCIRLHVENDISGVVPTASVEWHSDREGKEGKTPLMHKDHYPLETPDRNCL